MYGARNQTVQWDNGLFDMVRLDRSVLFLRDLPARVQVESSESHNAN